MIVYHGSNYRFDFPDYGMMTENSFPLGLWTSRTPEQAQRYGPYIYEVEIETTPLILQTDELLSRPRHIHLRDGRDVMMTADRQSVVIINFDAITSFVYRDIENHRGHSDVYRRRRRVHGDRFHSAHRGHRRALWAVR